MKSKLLSSLFIASAAFLSASCSSVDDERIPPANVNIVFSTIGEWEIYGVAGAGDSREFIVSERVPAGFPYKGLEGTGYGGLLLIADPLGEFRVFDLACPVCVPKVSRIRPDKDSNTAGIYRCPTCNSTYDTYALGTPHSGPALSDKYGLQRYRITVGGLSPYAVISR